MLTVTYILLVLKSTNFTENTFTKLTLNITHRDTTAERCIALCYSV